MLAPMIRKIKTLARAVGPCLGSPFMMDSFTQIPPRFALPPFVKGIMSYLTPQAPGGNKLALLMGLRPVPCVSNGLLRPQMRRLEGKCQVHHNSLCKRGD